MSKTKTTALRDLEWMRRHESGETQKSIAESENTTQAYVSQRIKLARKGSETFVERTSIDKAAWVKGYLNALEADLQALSRDIDRELGDVCNLGDLNKLALLRRVNSVTSDFWTQATYLRDLSPRRVDDLLHDACVVLKTAARLYDSSYETLDTSNQSIMEGLVSRY